jgi:hypothetical protein
VLEKKGAEIVVERTKSDWESSENERREGHKDAKGIKEKEENGIIPPFVSDGQCINRLEI